MDFRMRTGNQALLGNSLQSAQAAIYGNHLNRQRISGEAGRGALWQSKLFGKPKSWKHIELSYWALGMGSGCKRT